MPRRLKLIFVSLPLLLLIGSIVGFVMNRRQPHASINETTAKIVSTEVRRAADPVDGHEYTVDIKVGYEFETGGVAIRRETRLSKLEVEEFVPWNQAKVCYNESVDPSQITARLIPVTRTCGDTNE